MKSEFPQNNFEKFPPIPNDAWKFFDEHVKYDKNSKSNLNPENNRGKDAVAVEKILHDFLSTKRISEDTYNAANLTLLADEAQKGGYFSRNSARAINTFFENQRKFSENNFSDDVDDSRNFIASILSDRKLLTDFLDEEIANFHHNDISEGQLNSLPKIEKDRILSDKKLADFLSGDPTTQVPEEIWAKKPNFVAPDELNERLIKKINLESILISASEILEKLTASRISADNSAETLKNVFFAETLVAPIVGLIGIDGMEMALVSAATRNRMLNTGEKSYVDAAKEILTSHGNHEKVREDVARIFSELTDESVGAPAVEYSRSHHTLLGQGSAKIRRELTNGDIREHDLRFVWRRKSLGSLAQKIKTHNASLQNNYEPMDFIGGAVIVKDGEPVEKLFAEIAKRAELRPDLEFRPASHRDFAIIVHGDSEYRKKTREELSKKGFEPEDIEFQKDERGMNLSKFSFVAKDENNDKLPMELQVLTENSRAAMRYREAAHFAYKLKAEITPDMLTAMAKIHSRRDKMRVNQPRNPKAGDDFQEKIKKYAETPVSRKIWEKYEKPRNYRETTDEEIAAKSVAKRARKIRDHKA